MEYRRLGKSGIRVSPLCLGTMMFGDRTDAAEAGRIVAASREAGINFIDTADVYAKGGSERITGRLWQKYLGALDKPFAAEDEALVDSLVPAGHPSTPGFTDPVYLVTGWII